MLLNMWHGSLYGEEAIAKYTDDPDSMQFNCYFLGGVAKMTIEGNTISGVDADGNEIFRHEYAPIEVENNENGFLFYQSQDAESGQFTYFAFSPDTMADTYHLEFRYAEDTADLMSWFEGAYAYWNVAPSLRITPKKKSPAPSPSSAPRTSPAKPNNFPPQKYSGAVPLFCETAPLFVFSPVKMAALRKHG